MWDYLFIDHEHMTSLKKLLEFFSVRSPIHIDKPPLLQNSIILPTCSPYWLYAESKKCTFFLRYHNTLCDFANTKCDITKQYIAISRIKRYTKVNECLSLYIFIPFCEGLILCYRSLLPVHSLYLSHSATSDNSIHIFPSSSLSTTILLPFCGIHSLYPTLYVYPSYL